MDTAQQRFFTAGYNGLLLPRPLRRLIARSKLHRAWLAGDMGVCRVPLDNGDSVPFGVTDRAWTKNRKGILRAPAPAGQLLKHLLNLTSHGAASWYSAR